MFSLNLSDKKLSMETMLWWSCIAFCMGMILAAVIDAGK